MYSYLVLVLTVLLIQFGSIFGGRGVSSRDWPADEPEFEVLAEPKSVWSCDFERNDCGIKNDPLVGQFFQLSRTQLNRFAGKRSMLLLNITKIESNPSGARLITPYFQSKRQSKGCLTMDYLIEGNGIKNILVYQQEQENRCVWSAVKKDTDSLKATEIWTKLSLTVDLEHGDPRYFIEIHLDNRPPNRGLFALSDIRFFHNQCNENNANQCQQLKTDVEPQEEDNPNDYPNDLP